MITVGWTRNLANEDTAELAAMLAAAAGYDDEAGFSTATPAPAGLAGDAEVFQAIARLTPGLHGSVETPLAAFLRVDVDRAGGATAQLVVRPEYRSLGVATLMIETLAQHEGPGWAGTGAVSITCWAHGNHPAAQRMADRLEARAEQVTDKLVRGDEVRRVDAGDSAAVLRARADGFVHEHSDVCWTWRVPVPNAAAPSAG